MVALAADLFSDGFESGDLTAWSANETDSGQLTVTAAATLHGNYGLNLLTDNHNNIWVRDDGVLNTEITYRCRFYIDINSLTMADIDVFKVVYCLSEDWGTGSFIVHLQYSDPNYEIVLQGANDGAWDIWDANVVTDEPHCVEVYWKAATGAGNNDGTLKMWIDDVSVYSNVACDSDTEDIGHVTFGAQDLDAGTSGTFYLDDFASNDDGSKIGLVAGNAVFFGMDF